MTLQNFALAPGGRISGRITDAVSGVGLGGAGGTSVRIFNASGTQVTTGSTDTAGNFLTGAGLPTGNYFVMSSNNLGSSTASTTACRVSDAPR